ncbi:cytosolic sulfotransferase 13-like [Chenopodium quinoa]|uniref:Sulfotransferase n=1 Tax=Chenopodium quinoa TaxID=63459 RepID=A0A803MMV1_CHEQI|nr:cytosolic sulfotransferase 13-like [Chenopodium quinoa]
MAALEPKNSKAQDNTEGEIKELQKSLPNETWFVWPMYLYQGLWCLKYTLEGVIAFRTHFQAHDSDIILASLPKTGTAWLKSVLYTIVNRKGLSSNNFSQHPFNSKNPHELVLNFEMQVYNNKLENHLNLTEIPSPRLFASHMPYSSLPHSIKTSKCRIVYVCRNPFDTFVSIWHFYLRFEASEGIKPDMEMMEKYVDKFCTGVSPWEPYEDHVLRYWKESKQNPQKALFLEYEGLKKEPKEHLKRLAEFVGCPFSEEEEKGNVIDEIIELCSIKSLKEMEVNKSGKVVPRFENKAFFRKGEVGDWTNYLTPTMVEQFDQMLEKLKMAGFCFEYYQMNSKDEAPN